MTDREKVINGLTDIHDEAYDRYVHCQYIKDKLLTLIDKTIPDAIALLREQEAVIVRCKDCKYRHDAIRCRLDSEGLKTPDDWFCADGERQ